MEEKRITDLFFARDEEAIRETEKKYGRLCHSIAYNILGDEGEAEECASDTYMSLWNAIPPERPKIFKAYIAKVARNLALKRHEYNSAEKRSSNMTVSLSELEEVLPDESFKADTSDGEIGALINEFLGTEKPDARRVFIKRYYFGEDIRTISEETYFSQSMIKSMLMRTRNRLKDYLTERGVYI